MVSRPREGFDDKGNPTTLKTVLSETARSVFAISMVLVALKGVEIIGEITLKGKHASGNPAVVKPDEGQRDVTENDPESDPDSEVRVEK